MGKLSGMIGPLIKFGIALVALPFLGSFAAKSAAGISQSSAGNKTAHTYATVAAVISWVIFALIIAGILFLFFSGAGEAEAAEAEESSALSGNKGNFLITALDWLIIATIAVDGTMMLLCASKLDTRAKGETNYTSWLYATIVAASLFGLLGIYILIKFLVWYRKRQRIKKLRQAKFDRNVKRAYYQIRQAESQIGPQFNQQIASAVAAGRLHTELGAQIEANYQQHPGNPIYQYIRDQYVAGRIKNQHDVDVITRIIHSRVAPPPPVGIATGSAMTTSTMTVSSESTPLLSSDVINSGNAYPTIGS
jgi:NADH:ubiquinone oxidoreductase subunit 5 (subunit L)/multisubunit Na+/H+ antiporter MnhA subunit